MKRLLALALTLGSLVAVAQNKKKDDIVYYDDATVKHSRFGIAINGNPNFTDRRLINNEVTDGESYFLPSPKAKGAFQFNYGLDLIFSIGSSLDVSLGYAHGAVDYSVDNVKVREDEIISGGDTTVTYKGNLRGSSAWHSIPLKLNFNTSINDIWDLEVVPMVQLNFPYEYQIDIEPVDNSFASKHTIDGKERGWLSSTTYTVGLSLGGTYKFADNWGIIIRGNVNYMLGALVDMENYPRETTLSYGLDLGLKYSF